MLKCISLGSDLLVVDYTGRLFREDKAAISAEVLGILHRVGITLEEWQARLERLRHGRLFGRFVAGSRARLREVADRMGVHHFQTGMRDEG
jgi:hypothetical protein